MYEIEFAKQVRKDFKKINKGDVQFLYDSLSIFASNFSPEYEASLMQTEKVKRLQGQQEILYRLKLRSYRVIYKQYDDKLVILVFNVTTRKGAYR